jgi:hypothetical protein
MNKTSIFFGAVVVACQITFIYVFLKNMIINKGRIYWIFEDKMEKKDKYLMAISFVLMLLFLIIGVFVARF